jgi:hypothetical protein
VLQRRAVRALSQTPCAQIVQSLANLGERRGIVIVSSSWLNLVERRCSLITSTPRRQDKERVPRCDTPAAHGATAKPTASTSPVTPRSWEAMSRIDHSDFPVVTPWTRAGQDAGSSV